MCCGHFRIFVALLAAFGGFFGYLCRLNLSLVIEEMVLTDIVPNQNATEQVPELNVADDLLARHLPDLNTEERTFAKLSSRSWRMKQRRRASANGVWRRNATLVDISSKKQGATFALSAIEFNVGAAQSNQRALKIDNSQQPTTKQVAGDEQQVENPIDQMATTTPGGTSDVVTNEEAPLVSWSEQNKNDLLGAFFYGYVIFQVPAGRAAELYGPKLLMLWLGLGSGLSSLVFPYAALFWPDSIWLPWTIRFIMGISQAGLFPAAYVLLCHWFPKNERSTWLAVPSAFGRFGTIAMNLIIPKILIRYTWGWVFYSSGIVTLVWALLVLVMVSDKPRTSWWLSKDELIYIESRMERSHATGAGSVTSTGLSSLNLATAGAGSVASGLDGKGVAGASKPADGIDWFKMIKSRALLILTVVMFTSEWSNMLLLIKLPGFLGPAMKMSLEEIGTFSGYLVAIYCVVYPAAGVLASRLEACQASRGGCINSLRVRKLFELMAHTLQASGCLTIAFFQDKTTVLSALIAMMLGRSLVGGGQCLMPPELSKDYPGSVLALANSLANCSGILGPILLNFIVAVPTDHADWRNMWLISAALFVLGGLLFCLFADNRPQNYGRGPKLAMKSHSTDLALPDYIPPPPLPEDVDPKLASDEIIRMSSFARVSSEPQQQVQKAGRRQWSKSQPPSKQ